MKIRKCQSILLAMLGILLLVTLGHSKHQEAISVWGSTTCQKGFLEPGSEAFKQKTGHRIKVFGVGTGKGLLALLQGKTKVAAVSNSLEGAIKSARNIAEKSELSVSFPDNLMFHEIAMDIIVPIVHEDNPVKELTFEQLTGLNTGEYSNWQQVGGPNMPVQVVTSHLGSATRAYFRKVVMNKADYAFDAIRVSSTRYEIQKVSNHEGGIGAVSEKFFKMNPGRTKIIKTAEISRPLALITIGKPVTEIQELIDFFRSPEGQKFIQ